MPSFFISDLHLNDNTPAVAAGFERFLRETAAGAERLFILGDFFDAWIGDDDDSAFVAQIKQQLQTYTQAGTRTYFQHGNRDFLIGKDFAAETGVTLLPETQVIDVFGERTLIMHGDSLCTRDLEYFEFRKMVRSPEWQTQALALPLEQRRYMARELRAKSQSMNAMKAEDIMDVTPAEVEREMFAHQVQRLIHGHTHRPARHDLDLDGQPGERWVLGDWHEQGWFLRAQDGELKLESFAL